MPLACVHGRKLRPLELHGLLRLFLRLTPPGGLRPRNHPPALGAAFHRLEKVLLLLLCRRGSVSHSLTKEGLQRLALDDETCGAQATNSTA